MEVARLVKDEGRPNDLLDRLAADDRIPLGADDLSRIALDASRFIGRAVEQVDDFLSEVVEPRLADYADILETKAENRVKV